MTRQRTKTIWAALIAGALTVLGLAAAPTAAFAAGDYATNATISDVTFAKTEITDGQRNELSGKWSLPNNPSTPAGFTLVLPEGLQGREDNFDLKVPGSDEVMGKCEVTKTELDCSIDDAYVAKNPRNLKGTFTFWASIQLKNKDVVTKDFVFKNVEGKTTVKVNPNQCTANCEFKGWTGYKAGDYDPARKAVWWSIEVPVPATGHKAGDEIVVTDTMSAGQTLVEDKDLTVQETFTIVKDDSGREYPGNWKNLPASDVKVTTGTPITAKWTAKQGAFYRVVLKVAASDNATTEPDGSISYKNAATIKVGNLETVPVSQTVRRQGGSGTGIGDNVGTFAVKKSLAGDAIVSKDTEFTVHYVVTSPDGATLADADATVSATKPFTSGEYLAGSTVKLTEVKPKDSASVNWAVPKFDKSEFKLEGGANIDVSLKNTASLQTGVFKAKKVVTGNGASLIPADAEFTVKYNYAAGEGFAAGSGELKLRADGTEATSPKLPVGAVVKLSEVAPAAVDGGTWGKPVFSKDTVTIAKGETVEVSLENPITTVPPTTAPPTTPVETIPPTTPVETTPPTSPPLANTGASVALGVGAAVLLLAAGLLTMGYSRRRARH